MPAFGNNMAWNTYGQDTGGTEVYGGSASGAATGTGSGGSTSTATGGLTGGADISFGNGMDYTGYDATQLVSNPLALLGAALNGQGIYSPTTVSYYGQPFTQGFNTFATLNLAPGLDSAGIQEYMRLMGLYESTGDENYLRQAEDARIAAGFSNQAAAGLGQEYLGALQGGGIDANAAMSRMVGLNAQPDNALRLLLSQGTPDQKVASAIGMIEDTLVTSNPYMADLFMAVLRWMGLNYQTDPSVNQDRTTFIDYLTGNNQGVPATFSGGGASGGGGGGGFR